MRRAPRCGPPLSLGEACADMVPAGAPMAAAVGVNHEAATGRRVEPDAERAILRRVSWPGRNNLVPADLAAEGVRACVKVERGRCAKPVRGLLRWICRLSIVRGHLIP